MTKITLAIALVFVVFLTTFAQFDPDAGLMPSLTTNENVTLISSSGVRLDEITDGDETTHWASANPIPFDFMKRPDQNVFIGATINCTINDGSSSPCPIVNDENNGNKIDIPVDETSEMAQLDLSFNALNLVGLSVKIFGNNEAPVHITAIDESDVEHIVGTYSTIIGENSTIQFFNAPIPDVSKLRFKSAEKFEFSEIAVLDNNPIEYIIIDFGGEQNLSQLYTKHFSGLNSEGKPTAERIKVFVWDDVNATPPEVDENSTADSWICVTDLKPEPTQIIPSVFPNFMSARYIKIEYEVTPQPFQKVWFFEIDAYDEQGRYGPRPPAKESSVTVEQLLGVNAVHGWGTGKSSSLPEGGKPERYRPIGAHARNYHFMDFDAMLVTSPPPNYQRIVDPDLPPFFGNLNKPITETQTAPKTGEEITVINQQPLVNWVSEYNAWHDAGFDVQSCLMFQNFDARGEVWKSLDEGCLTSCEDQCEVDDPDGCTDDCDCKEDCIEKCTFVELDAQGYYLAARRYGQEFAKYFGPSSTETYDGVKRFTVPLVEVGNEPWKYDAALYRNILNSMAKGLDETDPAIKIIPCALQAADKNVEVNINGIFKNYMGARIKESTLSFLDGLNVHLYAYVTDAFGKITATYPENSNSLFNEVHNAIRWRDHNMPDKPIYCTEWGWDHQGAGMQGCFNSECVSERAATAYATRGVLLLQRLGLERATWFFYADTEDTQVRDGQNYTTRYWRSGLTGSKTDNFAKKRTFFALESLVNQVGDKKFLKTIQEEDDAWVYLMGDDTNTPTHIIAWRPTDGDDLTTLEIDIAGEIIDVDNNITQYYIPKSAVALDGASSNGTPVALPKYKVDRMTLDIGTIPTIIEVATCTDNCPDAVIVQPKVFLQGAFQSSNPLMNDVLRSADLIPALEAIPSTDHLGARTVNEGIFKSTSDSEAIVDAITVELRDATPDKNILATRAAFVQKDGDIVDVDGVSPVIFIGFSAGDYNIAIKHRNHLAIVTDQPISLSGWDSSN